MVQYCKERSGIRYMCKDGGHQVTHCPKDVTHEIVKGLDLNRQQGPMVEDCCAVQPA